MCIGLWWENIEDLWRRTSHPWLHGFSYCTRGNKCTTTFQHGFSVSVSPFHLLWTLDSFWTTPAPLRVCFLCKLYLYRKKKLLKGSKQFMTCMFLLFLSGWADTTNADTDELNKRLWWTLTLNRQTTADVCLRLFPKNQRQWLKMFISLLCWRFLFHRITHTSHHRVKSLAKTIQKSVRSLFHGLTNIFPQNAFSSVFYYYYFFFYNKQVKSFQPEAKKAHSDIVSPS